MSGKRSKNRHSFISPDSFQMDAESEALVESDALDVWLVERYHLYTNHKRKLYRGDAVHKPWKLRQLKLLSCEDKLSPQFGFNSASEIHARFAEPLDVRFRPFVKLESS